MKKLVIAFIIMLSVSCSKQEIDVKDYTPLPNTIVKTLTDTSIKYNQATIVVGDYLYVIENKAVIKKISILDNHTAFFILFLTVIICIISFAYILNDD